MTQPAKVVNFLDFFGHWDPSLAFVMGGALLVNLVAYQWSQKTDEPITARKFYIPTRNDLDWKLIGGGALFGAGWGLAGYCPGPAITSLPAGGTSIAVFVAAMAGGMYLHGLFDRHVLSSGETSESADLPEKVRVSSN